MNKAPYYQSSTDNELSSVPSANESLSVTPLGAPSSSSDDFSSDDGQVIYIPTPTPEEYALMEKQERDRLIEFYRSSKPYEISNWYPFFQEFTAHSICKVMTVGQAKVLTDMYYGKEYDPKYYEELKNLVQDLIRQQGGCCFMKLATRSPKDYIWDFKEYDFGLIHNQLLERLKQAYRQSQMSDSQLTNSIYRFFLDISKDRLAIRNAQDFFKMFGLSNRIIIDLSDLSYIRGRQFQNPQSYSEPFIELWVRRWEPCEWFQEFRCFFCAGKLTGVSQYDQYCCFPELKGQEESTLLAIKDLFEAMKGSIQLAGLQKGVFDVYVPMKTNQFNKPRLIEINVFNNNSRASLYSWNDQLSILQSGPLQLRTLKKPSLIAAHRIGVMMGMTERGIPAIIQKIMEELKILERWNAIKLAQ